MKIRKPLKITSRTSSITNSFVQAIIPVIEPTEAEVETALSILGMAEGDLRCVYCGAPSTDWDHLHSLVKGKRPTGYISEIRNLVPSCGPCNQSKSGANWRDWLRSGAKGSPSSKGIADIEERFHRLERYESWGNLKPRDLRSYSDTALWDEHWSNLAEIELKMKLAQSTAEKLRVDIQNNFFE